MNFTEQQNYIIAAVVSIMIHFLLLTIYLPGISASQEPEIETIQAGLVEISSPNKIRRITVALNAPGKGEPNQVTVADPPGEKPQNQSAPKENPETKLIGKPIQPLNETTLPEAEKVAASDASVKKFENPSPSGGDAGEITGFENKGSGQPESFRTGEAMVKIVGPMPSYPPAALKEGKEGTTAVRILVDADGQLELVIVTKSSGDIRLDYAATSSIERQWKFTPLNEGYYIDLIFSFDIQIGASVKFINANPRSSAG